MSDVATDGLVTIRGEVILTVNERGSRWAVVRSALGQRVALPVDWPAFEEGDLVEIVVWRVG